MVEHEIKVSELRKLLSELQDDDVLYPNRFRNVFIYRNRAPIGFINLVAGHQKIEWYPESTDNSV